MRKFVFFVCYINAQSGTKLSPWENASKPDRDVLKDQIAMGGGKCRSCLEDYQNTFFCLHKKTMKGFCCTSNDIPKLEKGYEKQKIKRQELNCLHNEEDLMHECSRLDETN
jgi:hypothetical protein